jgi:hypothetical protein
MRSYLKEKPRLPSRKLRLTTMRDLPRWPRDTPLSAKVGTKFRWQVVVAQSYSLLVDWEPQSFVCFCVMVKWSEVYEEYYLLNVMQSGLVKVYWKFRGTYCFHLQGPRVGPTSRFLCVLAFHRWGSSHMFLWNVGKLFMRIVTTQNKLCGP